MRNNANKTALLEYRPVNEEIRETTFTSKMQNLAVELDRRRSDLAALLHVSEARAREAQENARKIGALIDEAEAMINEARDKYVSAETRFRQEAALRVLAERKLEVLKTDLRSSYPKLESKTNVCSARNTTVLARPGAKKKLVGEPKPVVMVKPAVNQGMHLLEAQPALKTRAKLASIGTFLLILLVALYMLAGIDLQSAM